MEIFTWKRSKYWWSTIRSKNNEAIVYLHFSKIRIWDWSLGSSPSALLALPHLHDLQIQTYLYWRVETDQSKLISILPFFKVDNTNRASCLTRVLINLSDVVVGWTKSDLMLRCGACAPAMLNASAWMYAWSREQRAETAPNPFRDLSNALSEAGRGWKIGSLSITFRSRFRNSCCAEGWYVLYRTLFFDTLLVCIRLSHTVYKCVKKILRISYFYAIELRGSFPMRSGIYAEKNMYGMTFIWRS